jgi:hypothetical protein
MRDFSASRGRGIPPSDPGDTRGFLKSMKTRSVNASRQNWVGAVLSRATCAGRAKERFLGCLLTGIVLWGGFAPGQAGAQTPPSAPSQSLNPLSLQWPRFFATNGYEFAVYQPQIAQWPGNQLQGRFVVAVRPAGTTNETLGVVFYKARTEIDKVNRLVTLEEFQITKVEFPTQRAMQNLYQTIIQSELPRAAKTIPLDHLESTYAVSAEVEKVKIQKIDNTPPQFIYTTQPSLLVQVDGPPVLKALIPGYERVLNTRAILLLNTNLYYQGYYLYAASNWYSAPSLSGPWIVTITPPQDINTALDAAMATHQVDPAAPRAPLVAPPVIYVATTPTELLETSGTANLLSINGTDLLYVSNTDQAIFYYLDDANYYVLISGRWFKCPSLYGPWSFVASASLPADFKKIPPDSTKSNVLLSVAGTPQAQEAVIASTIPQTATVDRNQAKLTLEYVGAPSFVAIPGTSLSYAANTATPVIMVSAKSYYACQGGVWFVAGSATGPWAVATTVPAVIYTVPPTCPIHYVTYVYVYGYTPAVVYVGYTPGYMGVVVAPGGTVVYGTGYVYPPVVVGTTYVSYPPTYGSGASFALGTAVGFAFGYCAGHSSSCYYEPHYGCYSYAYPCHYSYAACNVNACNYYAHWGTAAYGSSYHGYNPYTGTEWKSGTASAYNPYTGTHGTVSGTSTYNPYTGQATASRGGSAYNPYSGASASTHASGSANVYSGNYSGSRQTSGYNPTTGRSYSGSSSVSGNAYNGNYNASHTTSASGQYSGESVNSKTTVSGNVYNGTASVNSSGSAQNSKTGNSYSWNNGTATADKNGNTYTYNQGQPAQNKATAYSSHPNSYSASQSTWAGKSSSYSGSSSSSWANKEASAQSTGSQRYNSWSQSGGGGWGSDHSSSGWGGDRSSSGWGGGSSGGGWGGDRSSGGWGGGGFHGGGGFRR